MSNNEMFKLANKFGSRVRFIANDSCFEFWNDGLEKFAEAYHLAKCANNAPIGYVREWEGDVSDANNFIFVEKLDELDDSPNWIPVFAAPQPSDAEAKLKIAVEALQAILIGQTTKDYNLMLSTIGMATIAKQALEKIGEPRMKSY